MPGRLLTFLPEGMKHIDRLFKLRDVKNAMLQSCVHPNLVYAGPDRRHRFPIGRFQTALYEIELVPRSLSSILGEVLDVSARRSEPLQSLRHRFQRLYKLLYVTSRPRRGKFRRKIGIAFREKTLLPAGSTDPVASIAIAGRSFLSRARPYFAMIWLGIGSRLATIASGRRWV